MKKFIILFLMFVFSVSVNAQTLSWQQCVKLAGKYNQDLIIAKKNLEITEYDYYSAWNNYYPSVNLKYAFSRSGGDEKEAGNNWSANANASQTLFDKQSITSIKSKKAVMDKTVSEIIKSCAEIYCNLKSAYLKMCYAQEYIELSESIYNLRSQSADIVRLQYEGGKESKGNMLRAQAQKHSAYADLSNAKRDLELAKRTLAEYIGADINGNFEVDGRLEMPDDSLKINIDAKVYEIPDVVIAKSNVDISEFQVEYSKANLYPSLTASASVGISDPDDPLPPLSSNTWNVGLALNYPLFSGGITKVKNSVSSSKAALEQTQQKYKKTILNYKTTLQEVQSSIERAKDNVETYRMFLEAAQQRQKEANIKYRAGSMEFQTWQDIEQEFVNNRLSHLSALYNYNIALAKKDMILGNTYGEIK